MISRSAIRRSPVKIQLRAAVEALIAACQDLPVAGQARGSLDAFPVPGVVVLELHAVPAQLVNQALQIVDQPARERGDDDHRGGEADVVVARDVTAMRAAEQAKQDAQQAARLLPPTQSIGDADRHIAQHKCANRACKLRKEIHAEAGQRPEHRAGDVVRGIVLDVFRPPELARPLPARELPRGVGVIEATLDVAAANGLDVPLSRFEHVQPSLHEIFVQQVGDAVRPRRTPEVAHA